MGDSLVDFVLWYPKEIENDIKDEECCTDILNPEDHRVTNIESDSSEVSRTKARIGYDHKHGSIPER